MALNRGQTRDREVANLTKNRTRKEPRDYKLQHETEKKIKGDKHWTRNLGEMLTYQGQDTGETH